MRDTTNRRGFEINGGGHMTHIKFVRMPPRRMRDNPQDDVREHHETRSVSTYIQPIIFTFLMPLEGIIFENSSRLQASIVLGV